jgi:hypothetical protein
VNMPHALRPDLPEDPLPQLRADFPQFHIWREHTPGRVRYVARRTNGGTGPHTLVTADPAELRRELGHERKGRS